MLATAFLPLGGVLLVTFGARLLPWRRLPPRVALWSLTLIAVIGASMATVALAVLAGGFLLGTVLGAWLVDACSLFAGHHRVPTAPGIAAVVALLVVVWRVGSTVVRVRGQRLSGFEPLTVVPTDEPIAFARSGRHGSVVVSTGMLRALQPQERRVLFAHERAHVRQRHDLHLFANQVAAAVVPWLGGLRAELRLAAERAADAVALAEVRGDRRLVATAISRAALAADRYATATPVLAFAGGAVAFRVQSLLQPPARASWPASVTAGVAAVGTITASVFVHHLASLLAHVCL